MKHRRYILLPLLFSTTIVVMSCNKPKKRLYFGTVLTKHQVRVPNATISFHTIQASGINGSTTGGHYFYSTTDSKGEFRAEFQAPRKEKLYQCRVSSDSGDVQVFDINENTEATIILNQ